MTNKKERLLITQKEAAEMLSVSVSTIEKLAEKWDITRVSFKTDTWSPQMHRIVLQSVYDFISHNKFNPFANKMKKHF